jgi:phosphoribosyl-AMP cyclohydrolase
MCFMMDEKLFGDVTKEVRGVNAGAPYEITYTPKDAIQGDYWCDVTYGMMAGLDPNRALVFGLQARGDKLISRDFLRRQMPWEMNVTMEEEKVEVEQLRDALMQAVAGYAQALPAMVEQGQDPSKVLAAMASIIDGRQKGEQIEAVVAAAFAPAPAPEVSPEVAAAGEAQAPGAYSTRTTWRTTITTRIKSYWSSTRSCTWSTGHGTWRTSITANITCRSFIFWSA